FSRTHHCSPALFRFASRSGSRSLHCDLGWVCCERVGVAMVRICVDCRTILGHKCPVCGDTRHKPARTRKDSVTCGTCWKTSKQNSTTGGFCEPCLAKRLERVPKRIRPRMVA